MPEFATAALASMILCHKGSQARAINLVSDIAFRIINAA